MDVSELFFNTSLPSSFSCAKHSVCTFSYVASPASMWDEVDHLKSLAADNTIVRHYLEPSLKAPRTFATTQDSNSTRSECLMKICDVGTPFPVVGSKSSKRLCERLWGNISKFVTFNNFFIN